MFGFCDMFRKSGEAEKPPEAEARPEPLRDKVLQSAVDDALAIINSGKVYSLGAIRRKLAAVYGREVAMDAVGTVRRGADSYGLARSPTYVVPRRMYARMMKAINDGIKAEFSTEELGE